MKTTLTERKYAKIAKEIANRLFTVSHGTKHAEKGVRLAVMSGKMPNEKHLGGWCQSAAEKEIEQVLMEQATL